MSNTVRIIGGQWRRRLIRFPDSANLRPTPDRVRETLFNWLGQDLDGQRCLDLFAGSGALGFEAASRGAAKVVMVEQAPAVYAALQENARLLNAENVQIVRGDALKFLALAAGKVASEGRFDVLFVDPPFRQGWLERLQPLLDQVLAADGALYVEAEQALKALGDWRTVREGKAGQVRYHLLRRD